jgi:hypothetical protein
MTQVISKPTMLYDVHERINVVGLQFVNFDLSAKRLLRGSS